MRSRRERPYDVRRDPIADSVKAQAREAVFEAFHGLPGLVKEACGDVDACDRVWLARLMCEVTAEQLDAELGDARREGFTVRELGLALGMSHPAVRRRLARRTSWKRSSWTYEKDLYWAGPSGTSPTPHRSSIGSRSRCEHGRR
jgi:hypothetical protein